MVTFHRRLNYCFRRIELHRRSRGGMCGLAVIRRPTPPRRLLLASCCLALLGCRKATASSAHTQLAYRNDLAGVRAAIASGAHVDAADARGHTCLLHAARWGHSELAEELLKEHGASVDVKEAINGNAALNYAAHEGHARIARVLLEHGADHRLTDDDGWTPLMSAASRGHLDLVNLLLPLSSVNADPETDPGNTRDWQNNDGTTPLMAALANGHVDVANALLDAGADVHRRKLTGANAVTIAAREG